MLTKGEEIRFPARSFASASLAVSISPPRSLGSPHAAPPENSSIPIVRPVSEAASRPSRPQAASAWKPELRLARRRT